MSVLSKDADVVVRWSTAERVAALKRFEPQAAIRIVMRKTGRGRVPCRRLPRWFVVWFVIAMGVFCRDSYQQVFRWLHRFRKGGTPLMKLRNVRVTGNSLSTPKPASRRRPSMLW